MEGNMSAALCYNSTMLPVIAPSFWANVCPEPMSGCWLWVGTVSKQGYGSFSLAGKRFAAHRYSWEASRGPIPAGLQIDHLCRVRCCVNPQHLEPVTGKENVHRAAILRTHCKHGHPFNEENTQYHGTVRICRKCVIRARRLYRRACKAVGITRPGGGESARHSQTCKPCGNCEWCAYRRKLKHDRALLLRAASAALNTGRVELLLDAVAKARAHSIAPTRAAVRAAAGQKP